MLTSNFNSIKMKILAVSKIAVSETDGPTIIVKGSIDIKINKRWFLIIFIDYTIKF